MIEVSSLSPASLRSTTALHEADTARLRPREQPGHDTTSAFPHLRADLDRVRGLLTAIDVPGRDGMADLLHSRPDATRRWIRPRLTLLAYYAVAGVQRPASNEAVRAAAGCELMHVASLCHDDILDDAPLRRGKPSVNARWGPQLALLAGDFLITTAWALFAEIGARPALAAAQAGQEMTRGVILEAADRYALPRTESTYFDVIRGKTAALTELAARLGAMQAQGDHSVENAVAEFGLQLGTAYQLYDDVIDLLATKDELGKPINKDIPNGIYTLPVLRALPSTPELLHLLHRDMSARHAERARQLVVASGAVEEVRGLAQQMIDGGLSKLEDQAAIDPAAAAGLAWHARSLVRPAPAAT
ncbi:polyprenyl synthetase family protein [Streptomyces subrutilus]|uniref:polyprenyl synthetase family protein n=1 Tax=Streptomyces subrutilus TaxID=36818 RepID=UPI0033D54E12